MPRPSSQSRRRAASREARRREARRRPSRWPVFLIATLVLAWAGAVGWRLFGSNDGAASADVPPDPVSAAPEASAAPSASAAKTFLDLLMEMGTDAGPLDESDVPVT
jgi:hypothetical protein